MISTKALITKANEQIAGTLTEEQVTQLTAIDDALRKNKLVVTTIGDLPSAVDNRGRLVYVSGTNEYYFSDGAQWLNDYSTVFTLLNSITYAWGDGFSGDLGDGTRTNRSSPVTVIGGIANWSQVSAGGSHSLGIAGGIAYGWGEGFSGDLGDGTRTNRSSPVTVVGGITNWSQVSAGGSHSLGIAGGIAYGWGFNFHGQVGDGVRNNRSSPVTVVGGITNWSQVSAGGSHSLGIANGGVVYAWGNGGNGQVGDGNAINRSSPVTVVGGITNWSSVSSGNFHSLGIANGVAYAWGFNNNGELGDVSVIRKSSPVTVVGGITNWSSVSAGGYHSLGIIDTGVAYAWGNNTDGQVGDETAVSKSFPVIISGGVTNWSSVSSGRRYSLGITADGIAYGWGRNLNGQVGDGTVISKSSPVTVVGGITNWSSVSGGGYSSLGIPSESKGFNTP